MTEILTHSGVLVDLADLQHYDILLADIAHALSHLTRFTGHCNGYTVAEHSVRCARMARDRAYDPLTIRCTLMHDAHEAYIGDVSTPLKNLVGDSWGRVERDIARRVRKRFRLPDVLPYAVHVIDREILSWEFDTQWSGNAWTAAQARREFSAECSRCGVL